jgi:general secretion pathway protein A
MYYRHFGLDGPPFRFLSSPAGLFLSESHREALAAMEWALLHEHCGFMVLIGETGTGKTSLLNAIVAQQLANLHLAYVTNPKLNFEELMQVVLPQLGAKVIASGRLAMIQSLEGVVTSQPKTNRTAIVIDEAQDLSDEALEDFRLLTNSTFSNDREIQFILIGQPELAERLAAPHLRQIRERIGAKATLQPLNAQESIEYINFRLRAVNGRPGIFEGKAIRCIVEAAGGNPRRLNVLCHNALLLAYSRGATRVNFAAAREVVADYEGLFRPPILLENSETQQSERPQGRSKPWLRKSFAAAAMVGTFAVSGAVAIEHASARAPIRIASYAGSGVLTAPTAIAESAVVPQPLGEATRPATGAELFQRGAEANDAQLAQPVAQGARQLKQIRIHAGDNFHDLAVKYLGSIDRTPELIMANPQIRNPDVIVPGQVVYLPSAQKLIGRGVTP